MADIRINALATTATTPASDDYLALDGTAQGTRKILATNIANNVTDVILGTSGPSVKSTLSARAPRQGLVFDGTAQGSTATSITALGTTYSVAFWINPDNVSGTKVILNNGTRSVVYLDNAAITTPGGVATGISLTAGKMALVVLSNTAGTMTPYLNGVALSNITQSVSIEAGTYTIGGSGTAYMAGFLSPLIYNRALSASEVVALYEAGAPAGADYNSASSTNIITGDAWYTTVQSGTAISSGVATITTPGNLLGRATAVTVGKRYRVSVNITASTGGAVVRLFEITTGTNRVIGSAAGTNTLEFTATSADQYFNISAGTATFNTISLIPLGLLLAPDAAQAGGGLVWYDTSGNAANITLPASGVSWNVPSSRVLGGDWTNTGTLTVSGTGASSFAGRLSISSTTGVGLQTALAVSSSSGLGVFTDYTKTSGTSRTWSLGATGSSSSAGDNAFALYDGTAAAFRFLVTNNGNLLIGTTTDGGQKLQVSGTAAISGGIVGTTTNDSAAAGIVGQLISATDNTGVSLTTGTRVDVVSISLTAGDWDVTGYVGYIPSGGASSTYQEGSISATSATIGAAGTRTLLKMTTTAQVEFPIPTVRVSLSGTTTYYLVTNNDFTGGTMKGTGIIRARRVR